MIYGIGVDTVEIHRINAMQNQEAFAEKILSSEELKLLKTKNSAQVASFLAKQFAAKEAVVKALGKGFQENMFPRDISVLRSQDGCPRLVFSNNLQKRLNDLGIVSWHVSLADERTHAIAMVVFET
ncbi:MAG: holo-ACP synthase [Gammaproteobacteria bacterium]